MNTPYASRSHEEMKVVLMDPTASGPAIHYYMIRGGAKKSNITVWESGKVGGEYIKAFGHYHVDELSETYKILSGEGVLLIQVRQKDKNGKTLDNAISSFKAIRVKAGDSVEIPLGSGHTMVNIGSTWLTTADDSPWQADEKAGAPKHADYEPIRKMKGFAYYVVEKDGVPALVRNPAYDNVPEAFIEEYNG